MTFLPLDIETEIFISCPANLVTGGPEVLHQLGAKLNSLGRAAYMFYYNRQKGKNPVPEPYREYRVPQIDTITDDARNILIVPEVRTSQIYEFPNITKCIWWLSVDNFFVAESPSKKWKSIFGLQLKKIQKYDFSDIPSLFHFVQSRYAREFLESKGIPSTRIEYLSDYLNPDFLKAAADSTIKKEDWIAYNPRKGFEFTQYLIEAAPELEWKPIQNMTRAQVIDLLKKSKVYIDFGNHPGKDRIPREAAICNCCVITGQKGSAEFYEDVPIQDEFKFSDELSRIPNIIRKIRTCLSNYELEVRKQDDYRDIIRHEEQVFEKDVSRIFFGETPKGQVTS